MGETIYIMVFGFTYFWSIILAGFYFERKGYFVDFKIIYLIAAFTPIWNTYLAVKYFASVHGSLIKAIKYHFTWGNKS